jgi:FixJ family two-component response regulator
MHCLWERTLETVYIVDDDVAFARSLARLVSAAGWNAKVFSSAGISSRRPRADPGACCSTCACPTWAARRLPRHDQARIDLPVIFLTGHGDVPTSVDAMKLGRRRFPREARGAATLVGTIRTRARPRRRASRAREARAARSAAAHRHPHAARVRGDGHVITGGSTSRSPRTWASR